MKRIALSLALLAVAASAQNIMDGHAEWGARLSQQLKTAGVLLHPLGEYPNPAVTLDAASGAKADIAASLKVPADRLYDGTILWAECAVPAWAKRSAPDALASAMRHAGYKLVLKLTSNDKQNAIWKAIDGKRPNVATNLTWKCDLDTGLSTLVAFQVGDDHRASFWLATWNNTFFGDAVSNPLFSSVQLKTPTGAADVNDSGAFLVELYNGNARPVNVTLEVSEQNAAGAIINVQQEQVTGLLANSPKQYVGQAQGVGTKSVKVKIVRVDSVSP